MPELPLTVLTHRVFPETLAMLSGRTEVLTNDTLGTVSYTHLTLPTTPYV